MSSSVSLHPHHLFSTERRSGGHPGVTTRSSRTHRGSLASHLLVRWSTRSNPAALLNGKVSGSVRNSIRKLRWKSDADQRCAVSLTSGSEKTRRSSDRWLRKASLSYETPPQSLSVCYCPSLSPVLSLRNCCRHMIRCLGSVGSGSGRSRVRGGVVRLVCVHVWLCCNFQFNFTGNLSSHYNGVFSVCY